MSGLGRLEAQVHPGFPRLTDGAKLERSDPWSGSGRRPAPAGLAQLKSRLAVQVHPEFHRLTNGAKLERSDPWSDSGRRPASAGLGQRSAPPSVPGPGALGLSQHARPGAACSSATRGPRPRVLGPRPGIAWGRLVHVSTPTRAVGSTRRSSARHPSQCPEAHRPSAPSQCPIAVTARRLDSRHPSQYPEAHGPSVPHARLDAPWWRWASGLPSQAERPASQPAGPGVPSRASLSVPGAATRPPATRHPPPRHNVRPVPIPTQARASATGGCGTGQHKHSTAGKRMQGKVMADQAQRGPGG